ncbi:hypothetical protein Celal_4244 [Cellulophaga algicola DSM 14237]|uniref:Deoxyribose-phosphate aldolase n=1 Tax=Cellulophaga algicola (strain DSM 14237 / IC166 / ACAM 630) TaxID=688270 RepID=E6X4A3_CELAD|nr:DUF6503 family protein [Cellulophaga algicola]ADV51486.1 hypothetical protein Celal_4244 [Cellulophaga algicola DSM 14237]
MKNILITFIIILSACKNVTDKKLTANEIVNKAILVSGGDLYETSKIAFKFRDKEYESDAKGTILKRKFVSDSLNYIDIKTNSDFQRYINDTPVVVSDSVSSVYGDAINSVHYFAQLPYHLNDKAVNKILLGEQQLNGVFYYLIQITFKQNGGGTDFDDTYYYWFNKETFTPDYLAYDFHTNGGGVRFRKAYNERYVNGIRFVDYENYKPKNNTATIENIADLYTKNQLELLSKIVLENITVVSEN